MGQTLFQDEEDEDQHEIVENFQINQEFAKRFEYNKQREEKQRLEEKYGKDFEEEESETDSEDGVVEDDIGQLITPDIDAQILKTLSLLQKKDEKTLDPNNSFFNEEDLERAKQEWLEKQSRPVEKGMTLKDYHRNQLLNPTVEKKPLGGGMTFVEEQEALKNSFKEAIEADQEQDLFTIRKEDQQDEEKASYSEFLLSQLDQESKAKWEKAKLDSVEKIEKKDEESFLMQYVLNRGWIDPDEDKIPTYNEITLHDDTDEDEEERADNFEAQYNFRFEEGGSNQIITHARDIPGVIRRKDNSRTLKREAEKEKKQQAKLKKEEELKRLKNLKKQEIEEKLKKIQEMAGGDLVGLNELQKQLSNDFDPQDYDSNMNHVFTDEYYSGKDVKNSGKIKKPTWDDDIDISDIVPDAEKTNPIWSKHKPELEEEENYDQDAEYYGQEEYPDQEDVQQKEHLKSQIQKYMDEYYQLDYEDLIGDMPVRFKYRQVAAESYSMKPEEILLADDTDLNNVVSLKKLGPYREGARKEKDQEKWKLTKKKKLWEFRSKLKGRMIPKTEIISIEEGKQNKRLRKEAKIGQSRLDSYSATASGKSKKHKSKH